MLLKVEHPARRPEFIPFRAFLLAQAMGNARSGP